MTVTLSTYGGLAAGIRRPSRTVKSSTLAEPVAAELAQLVTAVKAAPSVKEERPGRARDAVSYTITIEEDGGEISTISQSDTTMSPAFAALLEWLDRHSAGK
jgi:Emfourin